MNKLAYYKEIQSEASNDAHKATCHFLIIKDGNPHPHGSGVFIEIDNSKFLITAAHVVDNMQDDDIYVGVDAHDILKLGGELCKNIPLEDRKSDKTDIAILKLDDETIEKISGKYEFINQEELGINHEFTEHLMYSSVGFPSSKSKYNSYKNSTKSEPYIYITMPAESDVYEKLNCDALSNIIVHYDQDNVKSYSTGEIRTGPSLYGISGSGLWHIPIQIKAKGEHIDKKLVAIMTDWPIKNKKFLIGTRIDVITETIRKKYNLTVEKSKIIKINL